MELLPAPHAGRGRPGWCRLRLGTGHSLLTSPLVSRALLSAHRCQGSPPRQPWVPTWVSRRPGAPAQGLQSWTHSRTRDTLGPWQEARPDQTLRTDRRSLDRPSSSSSPCHVTVNLIIKAVEMPDLLKSHDPGLGNPNRTFFITQSLGRESLNSPRSVRVLEGD